MAAHGKLFFATREDLDPVLTAVEATLPLKYVRFGHAPKAEGESFTQASEIPGLGSRTLLEKGLARLREFAAGLESAGVGLGASP